MRISEETFALQLLDCGAAHQLLLLFTIPIGKLASVMASSTGIEILRTLFPIGRQKTKFMKHFPTWRSVPTAWDGDLGRPLASGTPQRFGDGRLIRLPHWD